LLRLPLLLACLTWPGAVAGGSSAA
jgi:hypothetical protein